MAECLEKYGKNVPTPINGYVLIHGLDKSVETDSGLMMSTKKEIKPTHGVVVAIDAGISLTNAIKAGSVVSFMVQGNGKEMIEYVNGIKTHLIPFDQVTAVHQ